MASYLDKTGLTTLWSKMKSHVSSNYLSLGGGSLTGELKIDNSNSSGYVRLFEDNEGGSIQICSKSGTYIYEIDAFNDATIRIHTALKNPNGGYQSIDWNGQTGLLTTNSFSGVWAGDTIPINKGGTGATTAANARTNLGVPQISSNVILIPNLGGIGTDTYAGKYWGGWAYGSKADGYPVAWVPSQSGTQMLGTPERIIKTVYANKYFVGNSKSVPYVDAWDGSTLTLKA